MIARLLTVYVVYLLAAMSPGPAVVYVMRTAVGSRGYGVRAALGVATGTALWVGVAALGLASALKAHPSVMGGIRGVGGAYFLFLAWKLGRSAAAAQAGSSPAFLPRSACAAYTQGVATNVTNPGTALFFTALLGLYDVPGMPPPAQMAVYLGIPALSAAWYGGLSYAFSNARLSRAYLNLRRPFDGGLAALFVVLGIKLLLSVR
ncbi:MAG: LysE family transporter [Elusimicrobia bacterium]|nr:LysE family transporter [Elusimicrobiota bacterium]